MQEPSCPAEVDMPALHDAANDASVDAQRQYLRLIKLDLAALLVGAAAGSVSLQDDNASSVIAIIALVTLIVALILTLVMQNKSYERRWYGGRAIAESVKTLAWRYMTRAEPFHDQATDDLFLARLAQILALGANLGVDLSPEGEQQITTRMRALRAAELAQRRECYKLLRIQEQRKWYATKARISRSAERRFFTMMWLANVCAVIAAALMIKWPTLRVNATGLFSTAAATLFAWLQVKRHQELAQSYSIAAQELAIVHDKAAGVSTEEQFASFVGDAETAISREHTLWIARRDAGVKLET